MVQLAERTKLIKPSVTLAIAAKANKLRAEGIDVVNFSAGEPDFDTPERILMRDTLDADLQSALDALPDNFREAVWLRDVEELPENPQPLFPELLSSDDL